MTIRFYYNDLKTAPNIAQIPVTATTVLANLEALCKLNHDSSQLIPQETMSHMLKVLRLTTDEKTNIVHLIAREEGVSLAEICTYTR